MKTLRAVAKKMTHCPAWLGLSEDRTSFVFMPDRAKVVREIFELSIAGVGGYTIAKRLNAKGVPAFGPSPKWDQSTIHNMLRNRATIGEYQPGKYRDKIPTEIPVRDYYPAVIEESLFNAAQQARERNLRSGRGRKGRLITNLFAGLITCGYCSGQVKLHRNGQGNSLICETVLGRGECPRFRWTLQDFENSFFECLEKDEVDSRISLAVARFRAVERGKSEHGIYEARADMVQILRATVSELTILSAGVAPSPTKPRADIRRDHPNRSFTVRFLDGSSRSGTVPPKKKMVRRYSSADLTVSLRLTPRQGALTALLADGEPLNMAAEELGMGLETARWHLREIFKRTNTHCQNDLISLAARICPPPPP
jgi:DNA-binding CsgD family transcriptional regulator